MCGICGKVNFSISNIINEELLHRMTNIIEHRGPDDRGEEKILSKKGLNVYLGHQRLSIIDPGPGGHQPMSNDDRFSIIYNGEVYNYQEIKNILITKGYNFFSKTDTEVVLNAYKEWGNECFEKFNGDWVISILDKEEKTLIIARDGIGTKPCFLLFRQQILNLYSLFKF